MRNLKTKSLANLLIFGALFITTSLSAGYRTTFKQCPDKPVAVIRCAEGGGDCEAEDQRFCDEIIIIEEQE
ncbi:hypothetical protein [Roseivirga echinicomitans]|uniref:Secreted protein n=1 Tax=Roseivirga echinicomitans TaxID=296218 RepID=A0A150XE49_9BACT|nr:hypothetical protein [Roseivirga echinicomitans]KYG76962.1 hypothetical protein AWN68_18435 [Roseivirga echinicomitans]